jgi:thymidylate synthase (FAD)
LEIVRMTERVPVLDHGYVEAVDVWGSDQRIVESARMSTQGGFRGWPEDERLLRYLWKHKHSTPFEFCGLTIEVQAPIFVVREWHRHRTQSYTEASARYAPLPDLAYTPSVERLMMQQPGNTQASAVKGSEPLTEKSAVRFATGLNCAYDDAEALYQRALSSGVPKELARLALPVGRYTRMRASANLRNWLGFLALRRADDAQWEIRQYANAVWALVCDHFPRTAAIATEQE